MKLEVAFGIIIVWIMECFFAHRSWEFAEMLLDMGWKENLDRREMLTGGTLGR